MKDRGFTLIELLVGLATAAIIAAVSAQVMKAGLMTYHYSVRQNEALTRTRRALGGEGASTGLLRAGRAASAVDVLSVSSAAVVSAPSAVVTSYYVAGDGLYRSQAGAVALQAGAITSLTVGYYNMNASGQIQVSSAASSATLVTALVTLQGKTDKQRNYRLFSGASLRNHP